MASLVGGQLGNWSHDSARQKALEQAAQRAGMAQGAMGDQMQVRPEFDWASKARDAQVEANTLNQQSSTNAANNTIIQSINQAMAEQQAAQQAALDAQAGSLNMGGSEAPESPRVSAYLRALRKSNNMDVNDRTLTGQMGTYGMSAETAGIGQQGGWDQQALGRNISAKEFLDSKKLQNQIARYKFGKYLKRSGEEGALEKWHKKTGNTDPLQDFISQVLQSMRA
jgi:hypothetical protein